MKQFFEKAKSSITAGANALTQELETRVQLVKKAVNGLPVLVSLERQASQRIQYDEKHYFVIPLQLSEAGFSLHTVRALPPGVPEVNALPKRRVFHFPTEYHEDTLRQFMVSAAQNMAIEQHQDSKSTLERLADDIDALDNKLTYGMIVVGGIAAIFNPLLGAGIAAKAVLPSVTGLLNKYGLKPIGEKATQAQIEQRAKDAEAHVLQQFSESTTLKVINPILAELEFALRTSEQEHDPLYDPNLADGSIAALEDALWRPLTEKAIYHVYQGIIEDPSQHKAAKLGPEDIRWLRVLLAGYLS